MPSFQSPAAVLQTPAASTDQSLACKSSGRMLPEIFSRASLCKTRGPYLMAISLLEAPATLRLFGPSTARRTTHQNKRATPPQERYAIIATVKLKLASNLSFVFINTRRAPDLAARLDFPE